MANRRVDDTKPSVRLAARLHTSERADSPWLEDPASFADFYDTYSSSIYRYFFRRTFDAQAALDLTAESFARAFEHRRRCRGRTEKAVRGWLFGIASNVLAEALRRDFSERRLIARLGLEVPVVTDSTENLLLASEAGNVRTLLLHELGQLTPSQRIAIELRVIHELPFADIAQRLGISEKAARMRVARGLDHLASGLSSSDGFFLEVT